MNRKIFIPDYIANELRRHLFQNEVEQGAFLFAEMEPSRKEIHLSAKDFYLVPPNGWEVQMDVYLQMKDSERAKIMKMARDKNLCAIDCHSHPGTTDPVWFSPSDVHGITEFAQYAKWKLGGKPFAAMVWSETSVDAVFWDGDFTQAQRVDQIKIVGNETHILTPTGSWFRKPKGKHRFSLYE